MTVDNIADNGVQDGIAEKLQPLVVHGLPLLVAVHHALVHQSKLIVADVVGIEAENLAQRQIKLLILSKRELHSVEYITTQHTS